MCWPLYEEPGHTRTYLAECRDCCNQMRQHWVLVSHQGSNSVAPAEVYGMGVAIKLPKLQTWARAARRKLMKTAEGEHFPLAEEAARPAA